MLARVFKTRWVSLSVCGIKKYCFTYNELLWEQRNVRYNWVCFMKTLKSGELVEIGEFFFLQCTSSDLCIHCRILTKTRLINPWLHLCIRRLGKSDQTDSLFLVFLNHLINSCSLYHKQFFEIEVGYMK